MPARRATLLVLFVLAVVLFGVFAFAVDHGASGVHIAQGTVVGSGPSPSGPSG